MSNLPPEILLQIFDYACSDEGTTARCLSLVCSAWYMLASDFTWRNLAVVGSKPIIRFQYLLKVMNDKDRGRIKHLFLGCSSSPSAQMFTRTDNAELRKICRVHRSNQSVLPLVPFTSVSITSASVERAVQFILTCLAPELITLSLYFPFLSLYALLPRIPMQSLQEVSIYGEALVSSVAHNQACPVFPSLRRAYIDARNGKKGKDECHIYAPSLTHLCLSETVSNAMVLSPMSPDTIISSDPLFSDSAPSLDTFWIESGPCSVKSSFSATHMIVPRSSKRWIIGDLAVAAYYWQERLCGREGRWAMDDAIA